LYSPRFPGSKVNHGVAVAFAKHTPSRCIGISAYECGKVLTDVVLLTPAQVRALLSFVKPRTRGKKTIDRKSVPRSVQDSEEFRSLCPQSASCLSKRLIDHETSDDSV
jgi:hypothetical protein